MSKKRIFAISLSSLFAIAIIAFIFWNSSKVAEESVATSDKFTLILKNILAFFNITPNWNTLSFIIRKAGHFIEYFALGGTVAVLLYSLLLSKKFIYIAPFVSAVVAIIDEFVIQRSTFERSPEWRDVGIDFIGALLSACAVHLLICAYKKHKSRKENKK